MEAAAPSAGLEKILHEEAWRNERTINLFRAVIWTTVGVAIVVQNRVLGTPSLVASFGLVWGLIAATAVRLLLRRTFHPLLPAVLTTIDVTVLSVAIDAGERLLTPVSSVMARHQIPALGLGLMVIVGANALRFSWRTTAWSVLCSFVGFAIVRSRRDGLDGLLVIDALIFASLGAILIYAGRKLRSVVQRVKERDAFARFLPGPAVDRLSRDPSALKLEGVEQEATVLFADIRDFTTMTEKQQPARVVAMLNEYFAGMVEEIFAKEGILDKFIGDGICAVFTGDLHARRAIDAAKAMLARLERLNGARTARHEEALRIGIGLHTGKVVAGAIGSPLRMEYTHIGDTVNTASRIEGLTKEMKAPLVVSEATFAAAGMSGGVASVDTKIRGRVESMRVYVVE